MIDATQFIKDKDLHTKIDQVNDELVYIGQSREKNPLNTDKVFNIIRVTKHGTITSIHKTRGEFSQKWSKRTTLFPTNPFENNLSALFDGINDRIEVLHSSEVDLERTDTFTLSIWFKSTSTDVHTFIEKAYFQRGYRVYKTSGNKLTIELRGDDELNRIRVESTSAVTEQEDGLWHHLAVTYDGTSNANGITVYIDSVSETLTTQDDTLTTSVLNIGNLTFAARSNKANFFHGHLDEPSIFNVEMNQTEINELYNSGSPTDLKTHTKTSNLIFWLRIGDNDNFPTLTDNSINTNDAQLINSINGNIVSEVP